MKNVIVIMVIVIVQSIMILNDRCYKDKKVKIKSSNQKRKRGSKDNKKWKACKYDINMNV